MSRAAPRLAAIATIGARKSTSPVESDTKMSTSLSHGPVTQAGNDRTARVIGYPLARRTRTILHIDFVAFFSGMSSRQ
jgi:hypothetical protein